VGTAVRPFGTKGDLRINPLVSDEVFYSLRRFRAAGKTYEVASARPHKNHWLIKIKGISSPEELSCLIGEALYIDKSELPEPAEDEVYWAEIEGFDVADDLGQPVGKLADYIETGATDVFIIKGADGAEYMISNNKEHVLSIDLEAKLITVARFGLST
jgi:16S rRNA processing protein RimM